MMCSSRYTAAYAAGANTTKRLSCGSRSRTCHGASLLTRAVTSPDHTSVASNTVPFTMKLMFAAAAAALALRSSSQVTLIDCTESATFTASTAIACLGVFSGFDHTAHIGSTAFFCRAFQIQKVTFISCAELFKSLPASPPPRTPLGRPGLSLFGP